MNSTNNIHNEALFYVKRGLPIIPICPPDHEGMSEQHKKECSSEGKASIVTGWPERKKTTEDDLSEWFRQNPKINIGVPLGQASGMVGIDIDGRVGEKLLKELSDGDTPNTLEYTTGKGRRLLYSLPQGLATKKYKHKEHEKGQEFAILCSGQYTVLPPSVHVNGRVYKWVKDRGPLDLTIAPAPEWVLDKIIPGRDDLGLWSKDEGDTSMSPAVTDKDYTEIVPEGHRSVRLTKLAGSMIRRGVPEAEVLSFLMYWNRDHCVPPIEKAAIEKMVAHISTKEQAKKTQKKSRKTKELFDSDTFVSLFLSTQKDLGYSWKYSEDVGSFYCCDDAIGPWFRMEPLYVRSLVRKLIRDKGEREWRNSYCVSEGIEALKETIVSLSDRGMFNLGSAASMYPVKEDELNPYNYICVENGILDWRNLKLHPWTSEFLTTIQLPVEWDEHADCPTWKRVLEEWIPDKDSIRFLQEYIGLCLLPDTSFRKAVLLYGSGTNGKSLFLDGIKMLFGDALVNIPLQRLTTRFETAYLYGKLINIFGDIDAKIIKNTGVLKSLIGGDTLRGEFKHGKSFDFDPPVRLLFSTNEIPQVFDKSPAWLGRWEFILFPIQFKEDPAYRIDLIHKMEKEKPGMLCWAVEGLKRLKKENKFTISKTMMQSKKEYQRESDSVADFLFDVLEKVHQTGAETTLAEWALHNQYLNRIEVDRSGIRSVGQKVFTKRAKNLGYVSSRRKIEGKPCSCLVGVKFKRKEDQYVYDSILRQRKDKPI